jgi:YD repeat-containing protein
MYSSKDANGTWTPFMPFIYRICGGCLVNFPIYTERFDSNGNLIGINTHRNGFIETNIRDINGNLIHESATSNGVTLAHEYGYSDNNIISMTNSIGEVTFFEYNGDNLSEIILSEGNSINYTYNNDDKISNISVDVSGLHGANSISSQYTYDGDNLATINGNGQTYSYEYDENDNLLSVTLGGVVLLEKEYNLDGSLIKETYANGQFIEYFYNEDGQISEIYYNGETSPRFEYVYTEDGDLIEIYDYKGDIKTQILTHEELDNYNLVNSNFAVEIIKSSSISTGQTHYEYHHGIDSLIEFVGNSSKSSKFTSSENGKTKTMVT